MKHETNNLRIKGIKEVIVPKELTDEIPITENASETVFNARSAIQNILRGDDDRLLIVVGPCSIHDVDAAKDYANKLMGIREELKSDLEIVMRVYFEKPRTTVGWKGLINDPNLDNSFEINLGLRKARGLLFYLAEMGMPAATEYLDLVSPQYITDLISWGAIGARTTESQVHRELASGLSCPVGFKNGTDGGLQIAIDAMRSSSKEHVFLSLTKAGHSAIFNTTGNPDTHIILRGGNDGPNYEAKYVIKAAEALKKANMPQRIMIDCSHANSLKQHERQAIVAHDVAGQLALGESRIIGVMIESNLIAGKQNTNNLANLTYGQSITDSCLAWDDTVPLLKELAEGVRKRREKKVS